MADLYKELKAEVRNERMLNLFVKHRYTLVALVVILLVVTGGLSWYTSHKQQQQADSSLNYFEASEFAKEGDAVSAIPRLRKVMDEGAGGWKQLAAIDHAAMLVKQEKYEDAKTAYEEIISDASAHVIVRDYAAVMSAWLMLEHGLGEAPALEARLEAMTGEGKPWDFTARQLLALSKLKRGEVEAARNILEALQNEQIAPANIQLYAKELLATLPKPETVKLDIKQKEAIAPEASTEAPKN